MGMKKELLILGPALSRAGEDDLDLRSTSVLAAMAATSWGSSVFALERL